MLAPLALALVVASNAPVPSAVNLAAQRLTVPGDDRELLPPAVRAGEGRGPRGWSGADVALELLFVASMAADWNQTRFTIVPHRAIPGKPGRYYLEINPILGRSPSAQQVDAYFLGATAVHLVVAHVLPRGWYRTTWQLAGLGFEGGVVIRNLRMNIGFRF